MDEPNLTDRERRVLQTLAAAWGEWLLLDDKHPDDDTEFKSAIHAAQNLIAFRVARRVDPEVWWSPPAKAEVRP